MRRAVTFSTLFELGPQAALDLARLADELGYDSYWTGENAATEAFSVLSAAGMAAPRLGLGTAIVPMQLRPPTLVAMAGATLQAMFPESEIVLGLGYSTPAVVNRWHGKPYEPHPLERIREYVDIVRRCLEGGRVDYDGRFTSIKGFKLNVPLGDRRPLIALGALNDRMLDVAADIADIVLLSHAPAKAMPHFADIVHEKGKVLGANVHLAACDRAESLDAARRELFPYITVDAYARMFTAAGYGESVERVRAAHTAGDRAGALAAISDAMLDDLNSTGDADALEHVVGTFEQAGADLALIGPMPWGADPWATVERTVRAVAPHPTQKGKAT
ncbi:MAG: LLM class flavin-dependent oxidoreductase [Acidimicrobiia bacterium]